jgi:hypothetical protein
MSLRAFSGALGVAVFSALTGCNAILGNESPTLRDGASAGNDGGASDAHVEAFAPLSDGGCPGETRACGAMCFDLLNDPANCGTCFHACPYGCAAGVCTVR